MPLRAKLSLHFEQIGMLVTAYSPLGNTNPLYAENDKAAPIVKHKTIVKLAEKYSATPAQILISLQIAVSTIDNKLR